MLRSFLGLRGFWNYDGSLTDETGVRADSSKTPIPVPTASSAPLSLGRKNPCPAGTTIFDGNLLQVWSNLLTCSSSSSAHAQGDPQSGKHFNCRRRRNTHGLRACC